MQAAPRIVAPAPAADDPAHVAPPALALKVSAKSAKIQRIFSARLRFKLLKVSCEICCNAGRFLH